MRPLFFSYLISNYPHCWALGFEFNSFLAIPQITQTHCHLWAFAGTVLSPWNVYPTVICKTHTFIFMFKSSSPCGLLWPTVYLIIVTPNFTFLCPCHLQYELAYGFSVSPISTDVFVSFFFMLRFVWSFCSTYFQLNSFLLLNFLHIFSF